MYPATYIFGQPQDDFVPTDTGGGDTGGGGTIGGVTAEELQLVALPAVFGSNAGGWASNQIAPLSARSTWASNTARVASNAGFWSSNVARVASNAGHWSSNVARVASNVAVWSSNASTWSSNVATWSSNASVAASNRAFTLKESPWSTSADTIYASSNVGIHQLVPEYAQIGRASCRERV